MHMIYLYPATAGDPTAYIIVALYWSEVTKQNGKTMHLMYLFSFPKKSQRSAPAPELPDRKPALDSRQQRFTARLANACEGSKLKEAYNHPTSGAPICRVIKKEHVRGREAETVRWPNLDKEPAIKTVIMSDGTAAKTEAIRWAREREAKVGAGV
jgi:hypothetical protein